MQRRRAQLLELARNAAKLGVQLGAKAGTWYMPAKKLPDAYGIDDQSFPESFGIQLLYPFRQ